jgi:hypothetical protein
MKKIIILKRFALPVLYLMLLGACVKDNLNTGKVKAKIVVLDSTGTEIKDYSHIEVSMVGQVYLDRRNTEVGRELKTTCNSQGEFAFENILNDKSYEVKVVQEGFITRKKSFVSKKEFTGDLDTIVLKQEHFSETRNLKIRLVDASGGIISSGQLYLFDNESFCSLANKSKAFRTFNVKAEVLEINNLEVNTYWAIGTYTDIDGNLYYSDKNIFKLKMYEKNYEDTIKIDHLLNDKQVLEVLCIEGTRQVYKARVFLFTGVADVSLADTNRSFKRELTGIDGRARFEDLPNGKKFKILGVWYANQDVYVDKKDVLINGPQNMNKDTLILLPVNNEIDVSVEFLNSSEPVAACKVYLYNNLFILEHDSAYKVSIDMHPTTGNGKTHFDHLEKGVYYLKAIYELGNKKYVNRVPYLVNVDGRAPQTIELVEAL